MTPLTWFGYLTATVGALAIGGVLAVLVYLLYHAARGWIGGADTVEGIAVGAAEVEETS